MNNISGTTLLINNLRKTFINNARSDLGRRLSGGGNNQLALWDTFGYNESPKYKDYLLKYRRNDIAKRIINATVDFTWKNTPMIVDDEVTNETETDFEISVYDFWSRFSLTKFFKRADKLACIGRYSVIVIGTVGEDLKAPLGKYTQRLDSIAYINVYSEQQAKVLEYVTDSADPRFGLPKTYQINAQTDEKDEQTVKNTQFTVDWSRVIHIAEELLENDVYGIPKLEAVYNLLDDLLKVCGGSAEMFFLSAYQGLAFKVKDDYELQPEQAEKMKIDIENYTNKLQRFLSLQGVDVQNIGSTVADPRGNFEVIIKLISGACNIPIRILLGSEHGQLAASVDQDTFFSYIQSRRNDYATETIIKALLDRLIGAEILPKPTEGTYTVEWQDLFEQSEQERANVAKTKIDALKAAAPFGEVFKLTIVEEVREMLGLKPQIPKSEYDFDRDIDGDLEGLPNVDDTTGNETKGSEAD
jgi:hypothetical protein